MIPFFFYSETTQRNQPDELGVVQDIFGEGNTGFLLADVPENSVVIPRFRSIPFGKELEQEVAFRGSRLINSFREYQNIANVFYWAPMLEGFTAPAYQVWQVPYLGEGEWFVKGQTNSIKNRWFECCYAPTTSMLPEIIRNNQTDVYVGSQDIVIRPFRYYRQIGEAVDGRPVFNERRCFFVNGRLVSKADYWSSFPEFKVDALDEGKFNRTVEQVIKLVGDIAPFVVIDFAEFPDGSWEVVELNDGCMSGLSDNHPAVVWGGVNDWIISL